MEHWSDTDIVCNGTYIGHYERALLGEFIIGGSTLSSSSYVDLCETGTPLENKDLSALESHTSQKRLASAETP